MVAQRLLSSHSTFQGFKPCLPCSPLEHSPPNLSRNSSLVEPFKPRDEVLAPAMPHMRHVERERLGLHAPTEQHTVPLCIRAILATVPRWHCPSFEQQHSPGACACRSSRGSSDAHPCPRHQHMPSARRIDCTDPALGSPSTMSRVCAWRSSGGSPSARARREH